MEIIHNPPTTDSFIPLSTHQSQTPESFFNGPPVLYHHSPSAKLSIQSSELALSPALAKLFESSPSSANGTAPTVNGDTPPAEDPEVSVQGVGVWVTSEKFILFSPPQTIGLSIPYPSISLHAIERRSDTSPAKLFLQILTQSPTFDDYDPDATVSLFITPIPIPTTSPSQPPATETTTTEPIQELYTALSSCADLHPDPGTPGSDEDADGGNIIFEGDAEGQNGLPPPMPGSGGWITAENVGDFYDEEGNLRDRGQGLGEGAGSVRRREEEGDGGGDGGEGDGREGEGDGEGEETKWRRTG